MIGLARWRLLGLGWVSIFAVVQSAASQETLTRFEFRQPLMGTEFSLILYTTSNTLATQASRAAFDRIEQLNKTLSDYDPESEAMRLCARAGDGQYVDVSADLYSVLERSLAIAQKTGGAFDPTVGPVVRLWRRARRNRQLPNSDLLEKARSLVSYKQIKLDRHHARARLTTPGMKLDFGGIAKGYAADEALKTLKKQGIHRALVAAAGDIVCGEPPPGETAWKVEVAALKGQGGTTGPSPILLLKNQAVSTSGDTEQFVEIDGVRYSHIVDPRTGIGVKGRSSVTVIAPEGALADSLATAASVLGPIEGTKLVENTANTASYFAVVEQDTVEITKSKSWSSVPRASNP